MYGYLRLEGRISSSWIFSRARFLEVACLDLEALAEKRWINSCSSFDLFFLLLIGFLHLLNHQLAGFIPEVIVSGIELNLAIVDIRNLGADLIQEITVMGYYDDGILKVNQEFLQPCDRIEIQMVGRLVEKQDIGLPNNACASRTLTFWAPV